MELGMQNGVVHGEWNECMQNGVGCAEWNGVH